MLIATQAYIKIERDVTSTKQIDTEHKRTIYLYKDKIVTKHRSFPIDEVFDVSYRPSGKNKTIGLLYLHTRRGLFPYTIRTSPTVFIAAFKKEKLGPSTP